MCALGRQYHAVILRQSTPTVWYIKDLTDPSGWRVYWSRDGFPSMGVYMGVYIRNTANTDYLLLAEDAQKAFTGSDAMWAPSGKVMSKSQDPPEMENPNGCSFQ